MPPSWMQARLPKPPDREAVRYYSKMEFKQRTLRRLADMVCGNGDPGKPNYFKYRSSSVITEFFRDCETDYVHDGSTRWAWVSDRLTEILKGMRLLTSDVSRTAQPFFGHWGFEVVEERRPVMRGVVIPNALMKKEL
jgi:hypothetical protein